MPTKKTMKKATKKVAKKKEVFAGFTVTVEVNDVKEVYKAETVLDALNEFVESDSFPVGAKTRAIFRVKRGKREEMIRLYPQRARRLMLGMRRSESAREVLASQLERLLNE